ncbi:hypothetical protein C8F04DRAFT_1183796 [Mycena alexandri]|uniref:Uncharacterized protein n=1 Tax=Mycena alexandri TaxID=1745969 RepID=A0AAD6X6D3_9AGAR|nr:hypothetical protein C8F04DRAFT_1183796 [Mycena alexandri]
MLDNYPNWVSFHGALPLFHHSHPLGKIIFLPPNTGANIIPVGVPAYPYGWGTRIQILYRLGYPPTRTAGVPAYKYQTGGGTSLPVRLGYPHTNIKPAGVPAYPYGWGTRIQILYRLGYPPTRTAGVPAYKYQTGGGTSLPVRLGYLHTNIIPASAHYQLGQVTVTALPLSPIFVSEASHNLGGSLPPVLGASHIMAGSLPKVTNTGSNLQWEACLG